MSQTNPLVSIIVPTYNRAHYLQVALESAVNQTYQHIEIIVADDGSSDATPTVVASFNDPRIIYRRNHVNQGMLANNLSAFDQAQGTYVANLHDDDQWQPNFLEKMIPHLEADTSVAVAFCDHYIFDEHGEINLTATTENTQRWQRDVLAEGKHQPFHKIALIDLSVPMVMGAVFRKNAIAWDDFPADVGSVYDFWLTYLACRDYQAAYYHRERLTRYRVHSQSEATTNQGRIRTCEGAIAAHARLLADAKLQVIRSQLEQKYSGYCRTLAVLLLRGGRIKEAQTHLWAALKCRFNWRTSAVLVLSLWPNPWLITQLSRG